MEIINILVEISVNAEKLPLIGEDPRSSSFIIMVVFMSAQIMNC